MGEKENIENHEKSKAIQPGKVPKGKGFMGHQQSISDGKKNHQGGFIERGDWRR